MAREINLVPDIKGEMIKTLKFRNFIIFVCIIVASASAAVVLFLATIAGGQQAAVDGKKQTLNNLSTKINSYKDLDAFITIKDQLKNLSTIAHDKKLLSRTFLLLPALLPKKADTIIISELNINFTGEYPVITFTARANENASPFNDYNVLLAFEKSMDYLTFDYGEYVDDKGETIPAYCIIGTDDNGAMFYDQDKGYYAYWLIDGEGCMPSAKSEEGTSSNYTSEIYNGQKVVRIWRTPQLEWLSSGKMKKDDGSISGVAHFSSQCINYKIETKIDGTTEWPLANESSCKLVPGGYSNGITVTDVSNARDPNGDLVLRFTASITIAPEFYSFDAHHAMAFGPTGSHNVTDSYVQIQDLFGEGAKDCEKDDTACQDDKTNKNGEQ